MIAIRNHYRFILWRKQHFFLSVNGRGKDRATRFSE